MIVLANECGQEFSDDFVIFFGAAISRDFFEKLPISPQTYFTVPQYYWVVNCGIKKFCGDITLIPEIPPVLRLKIHKVGEHSPNDYLSEKNKTTKILLNYFQSSKNRK
ncbi:MAG: hypothetical protein LBU34_03850, partial [Planctomycetaceae bacterium]|nr:hypothetical protein [Planctomycetaceae bacterium]